MVRLAGPYWNCERRGKVRSVACLLLLLTMGQVGLTVWGNYWHRALYDALEQRSLRGLMMQVGVFALIFTCSIVVTGAHLVVKRWLQIDWRYWMTEQLVGNWMINGRHYRLLYQPGEHDNPDQRIAEDIRVVADSAIGMAHTFVFSLMILGLFADILWSVSGAVALPGTQVRVPGYMVPLAFLYAGLGSIIGWLVARPLTWTTNALQIAEATFRFGLSRARENSEAIALMQGEPLERSGSTTKFKEIIRSWNRQSLAYMGLVAFGTAYGSLLPVFPLLVAAPQYIQGVMTLGTLMQAAEAFQRLTGSLSWPVDNAGEIARCSASATRVLSLYEDLRELDTMPHKTPTQPAIVLLRSEFARIVFEDLCIAEQSGRILIENLNENIRRGERILITGDPMITGSLFKIIGGLWPWGCGRVLLPTTGHMMFASQRPFLPEGTLRDALCYPNPPNYYALSAIRHVLEYAGLTRLAPRLLEHANWDQVLPQRTRQRLGVARILLHRPGWILMDEATNSFDPKGERLIIEMLIRKLPNSTLLNISFHPGLRHLHHRTLVLNPSRDTKILFGARRGNGGTA